MISLEKNYPSTEAFLEDVETHLKLGALMLEHDANVEQRAKVKISLKLVGKPLLELEAEAVYVAPINGKFQIGLELKGDWLASIEQTKLKLPKPSTAKEDQNKWGKDSESLYHAIAEMSTMEKIQLALKGGREERRILLKDTHYMVHSYILKNPKLTSDEVASIARMGNITGEMIKTISENTEWMANNTVRLSIVKSPKTPANIVQKHIGKLSDQDLLLIAKSESVRDAVSKMAKKALASRGRPIH